MSLSLRYMRHADIRSVLAIDQMCFEPSWSYDSYAFELSESRISHMVVLDQRMEDWPALPPESAGWLSRLSGLLRGENGSASATGTILGYAGLWKIEGEAHISTIATHPAERGNGFGEILLAGVVGKAMLLNAEYVVLEVRVSNLVAQSLYQKYGFSTVGRKRNYYRSDREDAFDMRLTLDRETRLHFKQLYEVLMQSHNFSDAYSRANHPRR